MNASFSFLALSRVLSRDATDSWEVAVADMTALFPGFLGVYNDAPGARLDSSAVAFALSSLGSCTNLVSTKLSASKVSAGLTLGSDQASIDKGGYIKEIM